MKKEKKILVLAACGLLTFGGAMGGAYALYTGMTTVTENTFTIKAGKSGETDEDKVGRITEDKWVPENAKNLSPNQTVDKNPLFTSNAEYEAWVIVKVEIPTGTMKIGDETTASVHDAVTLVDVDTVNWKLLKSIPSSIAGTNSVYYYGYKNKLNKNDKTTELFKAIQVPNITEMDANLTDSVDVSADIIQAEGYDNIDAAFGAFGI